MEHFDREMIGYYAEEIRRLANEFEDGRQAILSPRAQRYGGNARIVGAVLHQAADLLKLAFELKYPAQYFGDGVDAEQEDSDVQP